MFDFLVGYCYCKSVKEPSELDFVDIVEHLGRVG